MSLRPPPSLAPFVSRPSVRLAKPAEGINHVVTRPVSDRSTSYPRLALTPTKAASILPARTEGILSLARHPVSNLLRYRNVVA